MTTTEQETTQDNEVMSEVRTLIAAHLPRRASRDMSRVGLYVRISRDSEEDGLGVARQETDCRALATRHSLEVVDVFSDNDVSAYSGRVRPEWRRLIESVRAGDIDTIIAYRSDRLYRSVFEDLKEVATIVRETGVNVMTVSSGVIDLTSADGIMIAQMLGAVAEAESRRMGERIRRQRQQAAERGERPAGGRRAFGFVDNSFNAQKPREAKLIREAADKLMAGASLWSITKDWNDREITTPSGRRWTTPNLRRMMLSPHLAGIRVHAPSGTVTQGVWQAILTQDEHLFLRTRFPGAQTNDAAANRAANANEPRPSRRRALLSGIVYCDSCGHRLMRTADRYVCDRSRGAGCGAVRVNNGNALELAVLDVALHEATKQAQRYQSSPKTELEVEDVHRQLRERGNRQRELEDMLESGELTRAAYNRMRVSNASGIENLETRLAELLEPKRSRVHDLRNVKAQIVESRGLNLSAEQVADMQRHVTAVLGSEVYVEARERRAPFDPAQVRLERSA